MIIKGLAEEPLPVYGDGQNVRDWLYVEDHADALTLALERGRIGETYNIGGRNERANLVIVQSICDLLDRLQPSARGPRHQLISFVVNRPSHDRRYGIDASKFETKVGRRAVALRSCPNQDRSSVSGKSPLVAGDPWSRLHSQTDRPV